MSVALSRIEVWMSRRRPDLEASEWLHKLRDKHVDTYRHCIRVAAVAGILGRAMRLSEAEIDHLKTGCLLHDIGKVMIPLEVLDSADPLTEAEWRLMKLHPEVGAELLVHSALSTQVVNIVRHHHERWDGGGYPQGLREEEIPLLTRICSVTDAFDSMLIDRPYRQGRTIQQAFGELIRHSSKQFDTAIVKQFESVLDELKQIYPTHGNG